MKTLMMSSAFKDKFTLKWLTDQPFIPMINTMVDAVNLTMDQSTSNIGVEN